MAQGMRGIVSLMTPAPPVDLAAVILTALLNPAVDGRGLLDGAQGRSDGRSCPWRRSRRRWRARSLAYIAVRLGVRGVAQVGRAAAGVFIAQFVFGLAWAYLGHRLLAAMTGKFP